MWRRQLLLQTMVNGSDDGSTLCENAKNVIGRQREISRSGGVTRPLAFEDLAFVENGFTNLVVSGVDQHTAAH